MNAERLRVLQAETELNVQPPLQNLRTTLQQLSNNPQDTNMQTQFSSALAACRAVMQTLRERFTPAQMKSIL